MNWTLTNSADPEETPRNAASAQGLHSLHKTLRIFDFFSVRTIFISPNEQQNQYLHEWQSHE